MHSSTSTRRSAAPILHRSRSRTGLWAALRDLRALYRSRQALRRLGPRELDDIGISRSQAAEEADRPIWDVPQHWLR